MIELPEAVTLAQEMKEALAGREVVRVLPPTKLHKFCWFNGAPADYDAMLCGEAVCSAEAFGMYAEMVFSNGLRLCVNDGVNPCLVGPGEVPRDYQLLVEFSDGEALVFTVAMYGGIVLHDCGYDNEYYLKSRESTSPFSRDFASLFRRTFAESKPTLSAKAFLATQQRFPGVGNGVLQDILFAAGIHPRRKLSTFDEGDVDRLCSRTVSVLREMTEGGGRDTERDLFGNRGGYVTKMSKNSVTLGCPICGGSITRETYLGGSVYFCGHCQPQV